MKLKTKLLFCTLPPLSVLSFATVACYNGTKTSKNPTKVETKLVFSPQFKAKIAKHYPSLISKDLLNDNITIENFDTQQYRSYNIQDISYDDLNGKIIVTVHYKEQYQGDYAVVTYQMDGFRKLSKWEQDANNRIEDLTPITSEEVDNFFEYATEKEYQNKNYHISDDISYDAKSKMLYASYKGNKIALLNEINLSKDENLVGIDVNINDRSIVNPEKLLIKVYPNTRCLDISYRVSKKENNIELITKVKIQHIHFEQAKKAEIHNQNSLDLVLEADKGFDNEITENLFTVSEQYAPNKEAILAYLKAGKELKVVRNVKGNELQDLAICALIQGKEVAILNANEDLINNEFYLVNQEKPAFENNDPNQKISYQYNETNKTLILKYKLAFGADEDLTYFSNNHNVTYKLN
ncbi:lipoprotein 17-related variable surface protein [Mycoplasma sp. 4F]|uniref:lipoprotein 17-related variable surface protein n=1 Tax=Mycoplasma sp. 4F TaxID=3401664 RepID=UPI003AB029E8